MAGSGGRGKFCPCSFPSNYTAWGLKKYLPGRRDQATDMAYESLMGKKYIEVFLRLEHASRCVTQHKLQQYCTEFWKDIIPYVLLTKKWKTSWAYEKYAKCQSGFPRKREGQVDGWIHTQIDNQIVRLTDRWIDRQINGQTARQTERGRMREGEKEREMERERLATYHPHTVTASSTLIGTEEFYSDI